MTPVSTSSAGNGSVPVYGPFTTLNTAAGAQVVNRSSVAALAFLVWDILITFDDEVHYIWPRKWTYTKFVYFIARYLPVMVETSILLIGSELTPHFHFSSHDCYIWQVYQGVSAGTIITTVDTILILRVYALYHGNRTVCIVVACFFAVEIVGMVVGLGLGLPGIIYDDVCLVVGVPHTLMIYAASSIIYQLFLFTLTVYKFLQALRSGWGHIPLVKLLMRDGTWAFFLLFFLIVAQLSLYALSPHAYAGMLYAWLLTAFSFCGYRILINMSSLSELQFPNDLHAGHPATTRTGTHLEFSTQVFGSLNLSGMTNVDDRSHLDESYELSRSTRHDFRSHRHRHRRHHPPNHHQNHHVQHRQLDSQNISQRYVGACDTTQISTLSLG